MAEWIRALREERTRLASRRVALRASLAALRNAASQAARLSSAARETVDATRLVSSEMCSVLEPLARPQTGGDPTQGTADPQSRARSRRATRKPDEALRKSEQKVLDGLDWLETIGFSPARDAAVACLAGYRVRSSGWVAIRRKLRRRGLIAHIEGPTRLALTKKGRARTTLREQPRNVSELHAVVLTRLDELEVRILRTLLGVHPGVLDESALARRCGRARDDGAFRASQSRLRELEMIHSPRPAQLCASDVLLPLRTADAALGTAEAAESDAIPSRLRLVSGRLHFAAAADPHGGS